MGYGVFRRAPGIVLPGIDTSAKGGQYQQPFYSRQIIKGKLNLLAKCAKNLSLLQFSYFADLLIYFKYNNPSRQLTVH